MCCRTPKMLTWSRSVTVPWPRRSWLYRRLSVDGTIVSSSRRWRQAALLSRSVSPLLQHGLTLLTQTLTQTNDPCLKYLYIIPNLDWQHVARSVAVPWSFSLHFCQRMSVKRLEGEYRRLKCRVLCWELNVSDFPCRLSGVHTCNAGATSRWSRATCGCKPCVAHVSLPIASPCSAPRWSPSR